MPLIQLDHYTIRTAKLEETRDFYADLLHIEAGDRPPFDFPGYWLYLDGRPVVHLVGIEGDDASGLRDYLGDADRDTLAGGGAVDHVAFRGTEPDELEDRLRDRGIPFKQRRVPDLDLYQIFLEDPNGLTVELNFWGA